MKTGIDDRADSRRLIVLPIIYMGFVSIKEVFFLFFVWKKFHIYGGGWLPPYCHPSGSGLPGLESYGS